MKYLTYACLLLILSFSSALADKCQLKTTEGKCIGSGQYAPIDPKEALYILPESLKKDTKVIKVRYLNESKRYQERHYIGPSNIKFDLKTEGGFYEKFDEKKYRILLASWLTGGKKRSLPNISINKYKNLYFSIINPSPKGGVCVYVQRLMGEARTMPEGPGRSTYVQGLRCVKSVILTQALLETFIEAISEIEMRTETNPTL